MELRGVFAESDFAVLLSRVHALDGIVEQEVPRVVHFRDHLLDLSTFDTPVLRLLHLVEEDHFVLLVE